MEPLPGEPRFTQGFVEHTTGSGRLRLPDARVLESGYAAWGEPRSAGESRDGFGSPLREGNRLAIGPICSGQYLIESNGSIVPGRGP